MRSVRQRTKSGPDGMAGADNQPLNHRDDSSIVSMHLGALLKRRCPRCLQGQVFVGPFHMHKHCPMCRLPFEREPGYFTGAMYLSYALGIIATAPVWLAMAWFGRPLGEVLLVCSSLLIVSSPWLFSYARVLWLYLDQALDPR